MATARMRSFLWLLALGMVAAMSACHHTPAEQQVRQAIDRAARAARAADPATLKSVLSDDFDGNDGRLRRRELLNMLRIARLRGEKVSIVSGPIDIERRGKRLLAHFTVTLGGGGRWLPERLGVYRIDTAWREEGGEWRCYQARWKRRL